MYSNDLQDGSVQAVTVCASETKVGGAYLAVVTEAAPPLPEIADVEEESELAEEAPIAPPGDCLTAHFLLLCTAASCAFSNHSVITDLRPE